MTSGFPSNYRDDFSTVSSYLALPSRNATDNSLQMIQCGAGTGNEREKEAINYTIIYFDPSLFQLLPYGQRIECVTLIGSMRRLQ